jgi:hypothetical protein
MILVHPLLPTQLPGGLKCRAFALFDQGYSPKEVRYPLRDFQDPGRPQSFSNTIRKYHFLIHKRCDVRTNHWDSYDPAEAAEEGGSSFISYHSDIREVSPNVFLTGMVWNWGPIVVDVIKAMHNGTWSRYPNQDWWYGLGDGGVNLAPSSDSVPDNVTNTVQGGEEGLLA